MPLEVLEWESQAAFETWLHGFARRAGVSPESLFEVYKSGVLSDNDELWEWAQFWAEYVRTNPALNYQHISCWHGPGDLLDEMGVICETPARYGHTALGYSQGLSVGVA